MTQTALHEGRGSAARLDEVLSGCEARRVFLVCDPGSFAVSGAERALSAALASRQVTRFEDFELNPKCEDVERGVAALRTARCDAVVAVGGGSPLDIAKLVRICAAHDGPVADYARKARSFEHPGAPLIAIPTTAGSGAEATHFSVLYLDGDKYSVAHQSIRPDAIILDAALTESLPPAVTASTGVDALSQGIEAFWSVGSNRDSQAASREAVTLATAHLEGAVNQPTRADREAMLRAAHLGGKAIDIAKTTAAHALSYAFTSRYGVPHGHAVLLTLSAIFDFNAEVTDEDATDPRGAAHSRACIDELRTLMKIPPGTPCRAHLDQLMARIGLATGLASVGVARTDLPALARAVNAERLGNNPRRLTTDLLVGILESVF